MTKVTRLTLLIGAVTMSGLNCVPKSAMSEFKVVNGRKLSDEEYPAVVKVAVSLGTPDGARASCTASIISDSVLITAGHCLDRDDGSVAPSAFAVLPGKGEVPDGSIVVHPDYLLGDYQMDIAFVKFPGGTFTGYSFVKLSSSLPSVGDEIKIIGYGKYDHFNEASGGQKRIGFGTVHSINASVNFRGLPSPSDESGANALNSQGDSGGPMLNANDEIIGISSTVDALSAADGKREGHYTSIHHPKVVAFVRRFHDGDLPENTNPLQPPIAVPPSNGSNDNPVPPSSGGITVTPPGAVLSPVASDDGECLCAVKSNRYGSGCTVSIGSITVLEASGPAGCESDEACRAAWSKELGGVCKSFRI